MPGESLAESFLSGVFEIEGGIGQIPGLGQVLTGLSPKQADSLLKSAKELRKKAVKDIQAAGKDLNQRCQ